MTSMSTSDNTVISAKELEEKFDNGEDVLEYFNTDEFLISKPEDRDDSQWHISITLPMWLVGVLDDEANRRCVSRKAVINTWLVDRADAELAKRTHPA